MPPALAAAIIGAATAATTTGLELSGALTPNTPKPPNPNAVTPQSQADQKAAISQQLPTLQSQVGGSVSPDYYLQMAQLAAGTANQPGSAASAQSAWNQFGGPGLTSNIGTMTGGLTGSPASATGGTSNIVNDGLAELMKKFGGGDANAGIG